MVDGDTFCRHCGIPILGGENLAPAAPPQASRRAANIPSPNRKRYRPAIVVGGIVLLVVALHVLNRGNHPPTPQEQAVQKTEEANSGASVPESQPNIPPPKFRIFRAKLDEGISVVVAPATSDEQLKGLLWFFREMVRSHQFKEIGITQPTSKHWGKAGYLSGMISIYRGAKCANELFSDVTGKGPCGEDDHAAAYYQWGLLVNGTFDTDADSASIFSPNSSTKVFDYEDNWQLPADLQSKLDAEKHAEEEHANLQQQGKELFAQELQRRITALGYDITVSASHVESDELVLDSDMFKDTPTRVEFLNSVLPSWRNDLCRSGFTQVRLIRGGFFSTGDSYSIGCP